MNNKELIKYARSFLFTPAIHSGKLNKGEQIHADVSVFDLEDSVALTDKPQARQNLINFFMNKKPFLTAIRINSIRTREGLDDLQFLINLKFTPDVIFIPKVNCSEEITIVKELLKLNRDRLPIIMAIIESAQAVVNVVSIATASDGVIFGSLDFAADSDIEPTWESLLLARSRIVMAASNAGIPCIDTAYFDVSDNVGLADECNKLRQLGFRAKAAIHTSQVGTINCIFSPTQNEIDHATKVIQAYSNSEGGIKVLDSQMIGPPFVLKAKKILNRSKFNKKKL